VGIAVKDYGDPGVSLQSFYQTALSAEPQRLHFAAHSHHLWPDCTRAAQIQAWEDAGALADEKWERVFGQQDRAKSNIAKLLGGFGAGQICLAGNTHEFVLRLLSCFAPGKPLRVLTTDSEFHSFSRQIRRMEELPEVSVTRVSVEPFGTFTSRWLEAAVGEFDFVFLSHVFFNSGHALPSVAEIVQAVRSPEALIAVDGYHSFCALPISLRGLESRIFYLGGGYKYAQAGEGVCFLAVPEGAQYRPINTGWFAAYGALESKQTGGPVPYDDGAMRFAGATMDLTAAYRFNAVQKWWDEIGLTVEKIHQRVEMLKQLFVRALRDANLKRLTNEVILRSDGLMPQGHFVVFQTPDAVALMSELRKQRIIVDARADRLRFGFGLYHDAQSITDLVTRLKSTGF
jgi:kynureninase